MWFYALLTITLIYLITSFLFKPNKEDQIKQYFTKKTVLITGASMGIGAAFAKRIAKYQTNLILCARSEDILKQVAEECEQLGAKTFYLKCDVTKEEECFEVVKQGTKEFGGLDILFLNAGISATIKLEDMKDKSIIEKIMNVNFYGMVHFAMAALPYLKKSKGSIGILSSITGHVGVSFRTGYCASKFAVQGFFESLRNEIYNDGINISFFIPGWVDTGIQERHLVENQKHYAGKRMKVEDCVDIIAHGMSIKKRLESFSLKHKLAPLGKILIPEVVEYISRRHVEE
eukprot:gene8588-413_t